MGQVAISMQVMPDSPETDLEQVKSEISKIFKVQDAKIEPLAFGLKVLRILIIADDKKGADTDAFENEIKKIKGVAEAKAEDVTLI